MGRSLPILVESDVGAMNGQPVRYGYSPNYLRVAIPVSGEFPPANSIVTVQAEYYDPVTATLLATIPGHVN